jgi:predicted alpha-1,6-mannanase (GH76 family)
VTTVGDVAADRDGWAIPVLLRGFDPRTGKWRTPTGEAWQPALAIEAVLSSFERTGDVALLNVVEKSFVRYRGRRSRFFDDTGWYLNAWLRAFDATGDPKYLTEARALFAAMVLGWDERCGGGVWWRYDRTYKNAITNELFLLGAARLYRRTGFAPYRDWAVRTWAWFDGTGLVNDDGLVNDGIDGSCRSNGQTAWTYNQGVILGGLVELWRITGDAGQLATAYRIADATIARLSVDGVLRESTEPTPPNADSHLFKGILVRYLARLYRVDPAARPGYARFLVANADRAFTVARDPARGIGLGWAEPPRLVDGATHTAASLLFAEVALLERPEPDTLRAAPGRRYEAEAAALTGVGVEARHPGFTGTGYVAGWHRYGQSVRFPVPVEVAGRYGLTLRYAAGAGDAHRDVVVDGRTVASGLLCTGTGGWDRYTTVSLDVDLPAGPGAIALHCPRGGGYLNLDSLTVTPGLS